MIIGGRRELILLVVIGGLIGLAVGLYLTWEVWPIEYYDSDPSQLEKDYITDYIVLVAERHAFDGDTEGARRQLQELGISDIDETVGELTNYYMAEGGNLGTVRALAGLSYAFGVGTSGMAVFLQTATPTATIPATLTLAPTSTIIPTLTATSTVRPTVSPTDILPVVETQTTVPTPSATPTATAQPAFLLTERRRICGEEVGEGKIEVNVRDAEGNGIPGMKIKISWENGEEAIFTGLKPGFDAGYADFTLLDIDQEYAVTLPLGGDTVEAIAAHPEAAGCPAESAWVSWQLTFVSNRG